MKAQLWFLATAAIAVIGLGGCKRPSDWAALDSQGQHGRYVGIGIYQPEAPWTKIVAAQQPTNPAAALAVDDQAIFVVVDSTTGEIRACGDLSGYCIGMNPWEKPLSPSQKVPIVLTEHVRPSQPGDDTASTAGPATTRP